MFKIIAVAGMSLMLIGCGDGKPSARTVEQYTEVQAEQQVKAKLRDPESAQFSDVQISPSSNHTIACGKVNSKNGFGGMSGPQRFVSNGSADATFVEGELESGTMDQIWAKLC